MREKQGKFKVGVLFSGGKDSCLALYKAKIEGHEIECLLSIIPENKDSWMFHKPNLKLLRKQAEMLELELKIVESKGEKDKEMGDLRKLMEEAKEKYKIEGIVVGGIKSSYQGERVERICSELNLKFIAPLWDYTPEKLWGELLGSGFKVILTKIACEGIGKEWLGRVIDKENFSELKKLSERYKFRLDFEGGEAETSVLFMKGFKKHINIEFDVDSEGEYRHFIVLKGIN